MSFSNDFRSGRRRGVVGTLLALLVLVGCGAFYIFVFGEGRQGDEETIEWVIREQGSAIDSNKAEIAALKKRLSDGEPLREQEREVASLKSQLERNTEQIAELSAGYTNAQGAITEAKQKQDDYKAAYRLAEWTRAKGEKLGTLTTFSGLSYVNVVIREVNPKGIKITDSKGPKEIDSSELPQALVDRFQLEPKRKPVKPGITHPKQREYFETRMHLAAKTSEMEVRQASAGRAAEQAKDASANVEAYRTRIERLSTTIVAEKLKKPNKAPVMEAELRQLKQAEKENRDLSSKSHDLERDAKAKIQVLGKEISFTGAKLESLAKELRALNLDLPPDGVPFCGSPEE